MRPILRRSAFAAVFLLTVVAVTPAAAAATVAQAGANAINLQIAGNEAVSSGTYTASNDGANETTEGNNQPLVAALTGQNLVSAGTLAQDAEAKVVAGQGKSSACAGLAGRGATLVAVGDGNCLSGGDNLALSAGTVDLSNITLVGGTAYDGLPDDLKTALTAISVGATQITGPASAALATVLTELGSPGLFVNFKAIQADCTAISDSAIGDTSLANANIQLNVPSHGPVTLLTLPAKPAPNTDYTADLGQLSALIRADLEAELTDAFDGALSPLVPAVVQAAIVDSILTTISTQLQPLTSQLISLVVNKQSRPSAGAIKVTALDLRVLPEKVEGVDGLQLRIGNVACGPNGQMVLPPEVTEPPTGLPTAVSAGMDTTSPAHSRLGINLTLAALALMFVTGTAVAGLRRAGA